MIRFEHLETDDLVQSNDIGGERVRAEGE
jgi:hypothetical protein